MRYDTGGGYHFSLGDVWLNARERRIDQPHITLDGTQTHAYIAGHNTNQNRLLGNNAALQIFAQNGINNAATLLANFCAALVAKQNSFDTFLQYTEDLGKYKQRYPWPAVLKLWTEHQILSPGCIIERLTQGSVIAIAPRNNPGDVSIIKIDVLKSTIAAPSNPNYVNFLSDYCVALVGGKTYYIMTTALGKAAPPKSPQADLLATINLSNQVIAKTPACITTFLSTSTLPCSVKGLTLVFWRGSKCYQAKIGAKDALDRDAFTIVVREQIDSDTKVWLPQNPPTDDELGARAESAVKKAAGNSFVLVAGSDAWVVPRFAAEQKDDPTAEDQCAGLPVYTYIDPYKPRGVQTGLGIFEQGSKFWLATMDQKKWQPPGNRSEGIAVQTKTQGLRGPYALLDLKEFDLDRYNWINTLADAKLTTCAGSTLIVLADGCIIVLPAAKYQSGGSCFAATGTAGCLCFSHPEDKSLAIVDPAKVPVAKIVSPLYTLGNGSLILANNTGQIVLCPAASVTAPVAPATAGTIILQGSGGLAGAVDVDSLALLDVHALVTAGYLGSQVTISFESTLNCFVCPDAKTGAVSRYIYRNFLQAPLLATDEATKNLLAEIVGNPLSLVAAEGTGDYAGWSIVVQADGLVPLTTCLMVGRLKSGTCIISTGSGEPTWQTTMAVTLATVFDGTYDLLVTDANGSFAGYACLAAAQNALAAIGAEAQQWPGIHQNVLAYPMAGDDPQQGGLALFDVVGAEADDGTEPFRASIVRVNISPAECMLLLSTGQLYWVNSAVTPPWLFCTPVPDPATALVGPQGWDFPQVMAWLHPDESGYEADDEREDLSGDETDDEYSDQGAL